MSDIKNMKGQFMGTEVIDVQPKYARYKAKFQVEGYQKPFSFTYFMNVIDGEHTWTNKDKSERKGVHPTKLKQLETYTIGYTEYIKEGYSHPAKTAISFFEPHDQPTTKPDTKQISNEVVDMTVETYYKMVPQGERSLNHFIGVMMKTLYPTYTQKFEEIFNKRGKEV